MRYIILLRALNVKYGWNLKIAAKNAYTTNKLISFKTVQWDSIIGPTQKKTTLTKVNLEFVVNKHCVGLGKKSVSKNVNILMALKNGAHKRP